MNVWSRKLVDYSDLKVFKTLLIYQIKQIQLDGNIVCSVFHGYLKYGNGYELREVDSKV